MISERLEHTTDTISIHGEFDSKAALEFSITAQRAYHMGFRNFHVSLKSVTIIDKAGLMLLSTIMQELQQKGCTGNIIHSPASLQAELLTYQEGKMRPTLPRRQAKAVALTH
ncbi:MAG: hypothetical protein NPIRA02_31670 [Nitrospirales bacterium]|nr:MAG: hypothetical protein NPIRA02_31670 [Nitrospirales bacterium]